MTTPNDHTLPSLLTEIRWACGDNGKRMLPELVEHIRQQTARLEQLENEVKRLRAQQAPLNATVNKLRRENERLMSLAEALAWLEHETCDLRCINISNGDDYSVLWQVIEHHGDEPTERVIGLGETPAQAIRDAQQALAAGGG